LSGSVEVASDRQESDSSKFTSMSAMMEVAMMDCGEHVGFGMIQEQFQNRQNIPEAFPINTDIVSIIKLLIYSHGQK
jgi:hypothetical protein